MSINVYAWPSPVAGSEWGGTAMAAPRVSRPIARYRMPTDQLEALMRYFANNRVVRSQSWPLGYSLQVGDRK